MPEDHGEPPVPEDVGYTGNPASHPDECCTCDEDTATMGPVDEDCCPCEELVSEAPPPEDPHPGPEEAGDHGDYSSPVEHPVDGEPAELDHDAEPATCCPCEDDSAGCCPCEDPEREKPVP